MITKITQLSIHEADQGEEPRDCTAELCSNEGKARRVAVAINELVEKCHLMPQIQKDLHLEGQVKFQVKYKITAESLEATTIDGTHQTSIHVTALIRNHNVKVIELVKSLFPRAVTPPPPSPLDEAEDLPVRTEPLIEELLPPPLAVENAARAPSTDQQRIPPLLLLDAPSPIPSRHTILPLAPLAPPRLLLALEDMPREQSVADPLILVPEEEVPNLRRVDPNIMEALLKEQSLQRTLTLLHAAYLEYMRNPLRYLTDPVSKPLRKKTPAHPGAAAHCLSQAAPKPPRATESERIDFFNRIRSLVPKKLPTDPNCSDYFGINVPREKIVTPMIPEQAKELAFQSSNPFPLETFSLERSALFRPLSFGPLFSIVPPHIQDPTSPLLLQNISQPSLLGENLTKPTVSLSHLSQALPLSPYLDLGKASATSPLPLTAEFSPSVVLNSTHLHDLSQAARLLPSDQFDTSIKRAIENICRKAPSVTESERTAFINQIKSLFPRDPRAHLKVPSEEIATPHTTNAMIRNPAEKLAGGSYEPFPLDSFSPEKRNILRRPLEPLRTIFSQFIPTHILPSMMLPPIQAPTSSLLIEDLGQNPNLVEESTLSLLPRTASVPSQILRAPIETAIARILTTVTNEAIIGTNPDLALLLQPEVLQEISEPMYNDQPQLALPSSETPALALTEESTLSPLPGTVHLSDFLQEAHALPPGILRPSLHEAIARILIKAPNKETIEAMLERDADLNFVLESESLQEIGGALFNNEAPAPLALPAIDPLDYIECTIEYTAAPLQETHAIVPYHEAKITAPLTVIKQGTPEKAEYASGYCEEAIKIPIQQNRQCEANVRQETLKKMKTDSTTRRIPASLGPLGTLDPEDLYPSLTRKRLDIQQLFATSRSFTLLSDLSSKQIATQTRSHRQPSSYIQGLDQQAVESCIDLSLQEAQKKLGLLKLQQLFKAHSPLHLSQKEELVTENNPFYDPSQVPMMGRGFTPPRIGATQPVPQTPWRTTFSLKRAKTGASLTKAASQGLNLLRRLPK
jgi:hypothetical protein